MRPVRRPEATASPDFTLLRVNTSCGEHLEHCRNCFTSLSIYIPPPGYVAAGAGVGGAAGAAAEQAKETFAPLPKPVVMAKHAWHPHNLTDLVRRELRMGADGSVRMRSSREDGASFAAFQLHLPLPFEVDLVFVPDGPETLQDDDAAPRKRAAGMSGELLSQRLREAAEAFDARFASTFEKGMEGESAEVGKAALSNLLGGMGCAARRTRRALGVSPQ